MPHVEEDETTKEVPAPRADETPDNDIASIIANRPARQEPTAPSGETIVGEDGKEKFFIPLSELQDVGIVDVPLSGGGSPQGDIASIISNRPARRANLTGLSAPFSVEGVFSPIPLDEIQIQQASFDLLNSLEYSETFSRFSTEDIVTSLEAMEMVPEVAYVLQNPDFLSDWQTSVWPMVLDAMINGEVDGADNTTHMQIYRGVDIGDQEQLKEFGDRYFNLFTADEKDFFLNVVSSTPSFEQLANEAIDAGRLTIYRTENDNVLSRMWNRVRTNASEMFGAPEVFAARQGSPRGNLLSLAALYLGDNDISDPEDRENFFLWLIAHANRAAERSSRMTKGFDKIATGTVGALVAAGTGALKEVGLKMSSPHNYMWRHDLSIGQNLGVDLGFDPNDSAWDKVTGSIDSINQFGLDPLTYFFGISRGMTLTASGARLISKPAALRAAVNPHVASRLGVKAFDRRVIPRLWWAATSKGVDDFVESKAGRKGFQWIADTTSKSSIIRRFPFLKNIPGPELERLVAANNPFEVKEIWRGWMHASPVGEVTPGMKQAQALTFLATRGTYRTRRAAALAAGEVNLRGMDEAFDGVYQEEVYQIARPVSEAVGDADTLAKMREQGGLLNAAGRLAKRSDIGGFTAREADDGTTHLFDANGNWVAGFHPDRGSGAGSSIAVAAQHQRQGIATAILDTLESEGVAARDLLRKSKTVSPAADALLDQSDVVASGTSLYQAAEFTGSGAQRTVVSTMGRGRLNLGDLNDSVVRTRLTAWLTQNPADTERVVLAAAIEQGAGLRSLDEKQLAILREFAGADGVDGLKHGDLTLFGKQTDDMLLHGSDDKTALSAGEILSEESSAMLQADNALAPLRAGNDPNIYFVTDIPRRKLTNRIQEGMARLGAGRNPNNRFLLGMRRMGFQMSHALPSNISLTHGTRGSIELRNWIKFFGGGDELAAVWQEAFLNGSPTTRLKIVTDAMEATGKNIRNPHLKHSMIQFFQAQGTRNYLSNRSGAQIGLTNQGSNLPLTITHLTNEVAMPQAKELLRVVRRFQHAKNASTPVFRQGFLKGTKDKRWAIVDKLKSEARARGLNPDTMLDDGEDWITLAYADTLAAMSNKGRPEALGVVNKIAGMAAAPFRWLHTTFTLGQLAFRPMAWGGRVLLEEGIRAELVQLPSMWSNPARFISDIMDARAINKLSDDLAGQASVLDGLVESKLFQNGAADLGAIRKIIPGFDKLLDDAGIPLSSQLRVKGFIGHLIGQSLMGGEVVTKARIGSKFNWARRVYLKNRRINRAHRALDDAGLLRDFRWESDALDITNRSLFSQFQSEVASGYMDMEYRPGMMTPDAIEVYGRGWARNVFQMFGDDPLVRKYGLNRVIAASNGTANSHNAAMLVSDPSWRKVEPKMLQYFAENGMDASDELRVAEWWLTNVADETAFTLLDDIVDGDIAERGRFAQALLDRGTYQASYGDEIVHNINFASDNYEGVVKTFQDITRSRNALGLSAPKTVSAAIDARFGQREDIGGWFRRSVDWTMQKFGEGATQVLHRRPAYLQVHRRYYDYAIDMGASPEIARGVADEKATEIVNYIFFNNKDIPSFLKDMNQVIPFFTALFEVAQTWAYKIPAADGALGHANLLRKFDRIFDAMHNVGILETDEDGQMFVRGDPEGDTFSRGLSALVRGPAYAAQHIVGVGRMMIEPFDMDGQAVEPYKPADLSAWMKDGFTLAIGNPLDWTSHGILAVNQMTLGVTPGFSLPLGKLTETTLAADLQIEDVDAGTTLGQWAESHPDEDLSLMMFHNRDALEAANSKEAVARAFGQLTDPTQLKMPLHVSMPGTSLWQTLTDDFVFPFGKLETLGQVITSPSPAALQHAWRALFTQAGQEESEIMSYFFGSLSNYQMTGEVVYALQDLEATEGLASELMELGVQYMELAEARNIELFRNPDGVLTQLDENAEGGEELQAIREELTRKEAIYLARAHDNASGSMLLRAMQGTFLPATPKMFDWRQEEARAYWDQRNLAEEALIRGSINYADVLATLPRVTGRDLLQANKVVSAFMQDPSGDAARVWVRQNNPSMEPFLLGKSYWDGGSPPPEALEIDQWAEDLKEGVRKPFNGEVFVARMQRAGIAIDKEVAILSEYGNDSNLAAQQILMDYDRYTNVLEDYNMEYAAQDFLDEHLFEGRYAAWRKDIQDDNVSVLSETLEKLRFMQNAADAMVDLLQYTDLSPAERREIRGTLMSAIREIRDAVERLRDRDPEAPWLNPRDKVLANYWTEVATPYHEERQEIYGRAIETAVTGVERSIGFEELRRYDNEHFTTRHEIEGADGVTLQVPSELVRSWNNKSAGEKEERIFSLLAKKPEWLNQFSVAMLVSTAPQIESMLPVTDEDWEVYEAANNVIQNLQMFHEANPEEISASEVEAKKSEIEEERDEWLRLHGRGNEVGWRENWVPAQRLHFAGLLPESLVDMMPVLNSIMEALRAEEKSPTTNLGQEYFLKFKLWLESTYYPQHPTARDDLKELGIIMFDEPLESAIMARLFQDDLLGKLE